MNIAVGVRGAIVQNKPPAIFPKLTQLLIQVDSVPISYFLPFAHTLLYKYNRLTH